VFEQDTRSQTCAFQRDNTWFLAEIKLRAHSAKIFMDFIMKQLQLILFSSILLAGCATQPQQNKLPDIEKSLSAQYQQLDFSVMAQTQDENISTAKNLDLQKTLQIMLAHSPKVRIALSKLGIAEADQLQAELISNPHISFGGMKSDEGWTIETGLSQPLLDWFTRPLRRQLAEDQLITTQWRLQRDLQKLITNTSRAYFSAVAAQQSLMIEEQMYQATTARRELALSLWRAGNMSENNFLYYDNELNRSKQSLEKRKQLAQQTKWKLQGLIGLSPEQEVSIPNQLPQLPDEEFSVTQLNEIASSNRLNTKIIQQQLALIEKRKKLLQQKNGWRDISLGINVEKEPDGEKSFGPEIELALPLFNRSQGKIAVLDANTKKWQAQLQQTKLDTSIQIHTAISQMQSAKQQLAIITQALQVAEKRVALSNREVNFMLTSPFELLMIKRQQIQLAQDYTQDLNQYWQARSQLELAIGKALVYNEPKVIEKNSEVDHTEMDHSKMDHDEMDHSKMDHSNMNHSDHQQNSHSNHQEHDHD
jgi:outer membrane protein, heavy metal efflux system